MWIHCLAGYGVTSAINGVSPDLEICLRGLVASGMWAVLLGGPAAAFTAVFRAFPESDGASRLALPSPDNRRLGWAALAMLLLGLASSPVINWPFFDAYLIGLVLVVFHAVLPIRLGRFTLGSFALPAAGYGALTWYAGCAATGTATIEAQPLGLHMYAFAFLFLAVRAILWREPARMLPWLYATCVVSAFICLGLANPMARAQWRLVLMGMPFLGWVILGLWIFRARRGEHGCRRGTWAVFSMWIITDAAVVLQVAVR